MLPIRWDPIKDVSRELRSLHREMDDIFRRTFGIGREGYPESASFMTPRINTYRKGENFCIEAELPGVSKNDLDLSVEGNTLTLRGERKIAKETREEDFYTRECEYGNFIRRMSLPEGIDPGKIQASFQDGVLQITMPMTKGAQEKKIMIEGPEEGKKKEKIH